MARAGGGKGRNEQTELLRGIWNEMKSLNGRIDRTREDLGGRLGHLEELHLGLDRRLEELRFDLDKRLDELRLDLDGRLDWLRQDVSELTTEVRTGFDTLGNRIDNVLVGEHGRHHAELRARVERLEEHVGLKPPTE